MADIDDDIDRLYGSGLDAFVADRNALAKAAKRPDVKTLEKPSASAWAVNQLYWHDRATFDGLVAASEGLRAAHRALLAGGPADVRGAEGAHRDALRAAQAATRRFLTDAGLAVSPSTIDAVSRTLEALPHAEANGRLTKPLTPLGLDALAGLTLAATPRGPSRVVSMVARGRDVGPPSSAPASTADEEREAKRRDEALAARRREAAEAEVASAQTALATAETRLAETERDLAARRRDRDAARDRVAAALVAVRVVTDIE